MTALLTATTVLDGSLAVCSWALARGTVADGAMGVAGVMDAAGVMVAADTVTDGLGTADGPDTAMAVALDTVRGPATVVERGLVTAAAHGLAVLAVERGLLAVDSTAVEAEASMAVVADMAAADTGNFLA